MTILLNLDGHPLYKDAMHRENNRLAKNTREMSYDDYMPVYKNEMTKML